LGDLAFLGQSASSVSMKVVAEIGLNGSRVHPPFKATNLDGRSLLLIAWPPAA
jgi:hypothetical protein